MKKYELELPNDISCPICNISIGKFSRGITIHARVHATTSQELFKKSNGIITDPTCKCKSDCLSSVKWNGWKEGYAIFAKGHYPKEIRSKNTKRQLAIRHHMSNRRNDNDIIIAKKSKKISETLKEGFKTGNIIHWTRSHNDISDILQKSSEKRRLNYASGKTAHWKKYSSDEINSLLIERLKNYDIVNDIFDVSTRKNNRSYYVDIVCKRCNGQQRRTLYGIIRSYDGVFCVSCDTSKFFSSKSQIEIAEFVSSLGLTQEINFRRNRNSYEYDVYVESHRLAIEFNGLYWHCDAVQFDKNYHTKKSDYATSIGDRLIHIFEDEWRDKQHICKSIIRNALGLSKKIHARKCSFDVVDSKTSSTFFNDNHIDGYTKQIISFGLYHDGELVSCISLRNPFHKKWKSYSEIARYCTKSNYVVVGGLSKLIANITKLGISKIMTYADTRFGKASCYGNVGFDLVYSTTPSFWWTDKKNRFNRFHIKASKKDNLSQLDISLEKKMFQIWGCKNNVYVLNTIDE